MSEPYPHYEPSRTEIDYFFEEAKTWQEEINKHFGDGEVANYCNQAEAELEAIYPYFMEPVFASGNGLFAIFDENDDVVSEGWGHSDGFMGICHGVRAMTVVGEDHKPRVQIMHKILIGQNEEQLLETVTRRDEVFSFLDLDASFILLDEIDASFAEDHDGGAVQVDYDQIEAYSKRLIDLYRSTRFRRLKGNRKQQAVIDDFLSSANQEIQLNGLQVIAEAKYVHVPGIVDEKYSLHPVSVGDVVISGLCQGLHSVDSFILTNRAIRRDSDMIDKDAGLSLVIDPDNDTRAGLNLTESQVLFVPLSNQDPEVIFSRSFE